LDQSLIESPSYRGFALTEVHWGLKRTSLDLKGGLQKHSRLKVLESPKCRERHECGHVAEPQGGARVIDRRTRAAGGKESTLC
jgi:hypothetical protein